MASVVRHRGLSLLLGTLLFSQSGFASEDAIAQAPSIVEKLAERHSATFRGTNTPSDLGACEVTFSGSPEQGSKIQIEISSENEQERCSFSVNAVSSGKQFLTPEYHYLDVKKDWNCTGFSKIVSKRAAEFNLEKNLLIVTHEANCMVEMSNIGKIKFTKDLSQIEYASCNKYSDSTNTRTAFSCKFNVTEEAAKSSRPASYGIYFAEKSACNEVKTLRMSNRTYAAKKYFCNGDPDVLNPTGFSQRALDLCKSKCESTKTFEPNACDKACRDRFHRFCVEEECM